MGEAYIFRILQEFEARESYPYIFEIKRLATPFKR